MRKERGIFLKLLECQNDASMDQYLPKAAFCTDNQAHFWNLNKTPRFICTPKYLNVSAHIVCTGSLGLATPSSIEVCKDSKWDEVLFLLCYTQTNRTKTKSLECPSPERDWECVQSCSAVCFSPLTIEKALGDLLNDLSSHIRSLQWGFTGHSMSLRDRVWKYYLKISQRPKKANKFWPAAFLRLWGCSGFGLVGWLFFF